MAAMLLILLAMCCVSAFAELQEFSMDEEEMRDTGSIQDRLARLEGLEKTYKSLVTPEENRGETCLPEEAICRKASGPKCCYGYRCVQFSRIEGMYGAYWISHCGKKPKSIFSRYRELRKQKA